MSRPARILSKTGMYHIVFRGINRQDLFEEEKDYEKLIEIIKKVKEVKQFELYAYCLMTNHVHLFLKEKETGDIKKIMHKVLSNYVGWFNYKYDRSGSLIGNRYKSEPIESEEYYLTLIRYIHQNPLKAKMVNNLSEYKWSSYSYYISDENDIIDKNFALQMFNENEKIAVKYFIEFHEENVAQDFEISERTKLTDEQIRRKMKQILKTDVLTSIGTLNKTKRNEMILILKKSGFSVRVIERLTGISRGVIQRIK